jgi:hypothetical protein
LEKFGSFCVYIRFSYSAQVFYTFFVAIDSSKDRNLPAAHPHYARFKNKNALVKVVTTEPQKHRKKIIDTHYIIMLL